MFKKRVFNLKSFSAGAAAIVAGLPASVTARIRKNVDRLFAEKIRLAATSVNNCVYCSYGHTRIAMRAGISENEIRQLLNGEISEEVAESEIPGLLFAQHFAETQGKPENAMVFHLKEFYGHACARDILVYLREIQFGNLCGNTFEAFISRMKGEAAPGSSVCFETVFFIMFFPVLGIMHVLTSKK